MPQVARTQQRPEDAPDFASHRHQHPDDPLPALVLVADGVSLEQAGRLAAILAQGPRLGVGALLPLVSLVHRPVSLPHLMAETFGTTLAVIGADWQGWVVLWLIEQRHRRMRP